MKTPIIFDSTFIDIINNIDNISIESINSLAHTLFISIQKSTDYIQDLTEDTYRELITQEKVIQRKALLETIFPNFNNYLAEKKELSFEKKQQITAINDLMRAISDDNLKYTLKNRTKRCSETAFLSYKLNDISLLVQEHVGGKTLSPLRSSSLLKKVIIPAIVSLNEIDQNGKTLQDKFDDINSFNPPNPRILTQLHSIIKKIKNFENKSQISYYENTCILEELNTHVKALTKLSDNFQLKVKHIYSKQNLNSKDLIRISALKANKEFLKNIKIAVEKLQSNLRQYKLNSIKLIQKITRLQEKEAKATTQISNRNGLRKRTYSAPAKLEISAESVQSAYIRTCITLDETSREMQNFYNIHFRKFGIFNPLIRLFSSSFRFAQNDLSRRLKEIEQLQKKVKENPELYSTETNKTGRNIEELNIKIQKAIQEAPDSRAQVLIDRKSTFFAIVRKFLKSNRPSRFCPPEKTTKEFQKTLNEMLSQTLTEKADAAITTALINQQDRISPSTVIRQIEEEQIASQPVNTQTSPQDNKRRRSLSQVDDAQVPSSKRQRALSTTLLMTQKYSSVNLLQDEEYVKIATIYSGDDLPLSQESTKPVLEETAQTLVQLVKQGKFTINDLAKELKTARQKSDTSLEATYLIKALTSQGLFSPPLPIGYGALAARNTASLYKISAANALNLNQVLIPTRVS